MKVVASVLMVAVCLFLVVHLSGAANPGKDARVIEIHAQRFEYKPAEIRISAGQAVELHITSKDVLHGFFIPEINVRADLMPGKTAVVKIPALKKGEYPFICDIFCGSQHSGMQGKLVVE